MNPSVRSPAGPESLRLDGNLVDSIDKETRAKIWLSAEAILERGPLATGVGGTTGLALGFVQSGKTTSIAALTALAADRGYRVIVAMLGVTNILLAQNQERIEKLLSLMDRSDFRWAVEQNPSGRRKATQISDWLDRGRTVFIPILKHAGRIDKLTEVLRLVGVEDEAILIIDDEGDQTSLNTESASGAKSLSRTYEAITGLRSVAPMNLFVQYTATPYAPLLIDPEDHLLPEFVEFLHPGPGYTGGREFFIDHADQVVRDVPALHEQSTQAPIELPASLVEALASFVAGASLLLAHDPAGFPVSMLVHSTHRNDIQARYHFLLDRKVRQWRDVILSAAEVSELPDQIQFERNRLVQLGAVDVGDDLFLRRVQDVANGVILWLVNSKNDGDAVDWHIAPVHILVGGNILSRGFTVEGLTVTYMNRKPSNQIDTLEQRARAFGYRQDQLPYCQFFASKRTIGLLRDVVFTEYDLRARLQDHVAAGGTISSWAEQIGLLLPEGAKPTRPNVVRALLRTSPGWRTLRRPSLDLDDLDANRRLVDALGLTSAPEVDYGRLPHRTLLLSLDEVISRLIEPWRTTSYSPDWRQDEVVEILDFTRRFPIQEKLVPVLFMEENGGPRRRQWHSETGFVNLFQGRDVRPSPGKPSYPGDRSVPNLENDADAIVVQVHRVVRVIDGESVGPEILTLAVHLGERPIVRAKLSDREDQEASIV